MFFIKAIKSLILGDTFSKKNDFINLSFSQEGEDLIIKRYFEGKKTELFYVDAGAHHPFRYSNTAIFYKTGSRGINIDADIDAIELFFKERPRDINIHSGVGLKEGSQKFYEFKEKALSTFSPEIYQERVDKGFAINRIVNVSIQSIEKILSGINLNLEIDFLNIDIEGFDFEALQSNNWDKYRPKLILIEIRDFDPENLTDRVSNFLRSKNYRFYAKTVKTVFFEKIT
ncbi:MAG: hypothetical protein OHK0053_23580 [Microscillaceae bacterium]